MEQNRPAARPMERRRLTKEEWEARRRRRRLRLVRNWVLFLSACAGMIALMTSGVLWLLPRAQALVNSPEAFEPQQYDAASYVFNEADERLTLVNGNLPLEEEPLPDLATADEAAGVQLEAEAAAAYREMAAAALEDGISLTLAAGYQDEETRQAAFDTEKQQYLENGCSEETAAARAATIVPQAACNEHATGYAADILSEDHPEADTGFAGTRAYEWLSAYAAEYGFILRYPEERQAATGVVFEPWHWRYVGTENALAIRDSGLSLEEFLAVEQGK